MHEESRFQTHRFREDDRYCWEVTDTIGGRTEHAYSLTEIADAQDCMREGIVFEGFHDHTFPVDEHAVTVRIGFRMHEMEPGFSGWHIVAINGQKPDSGLELKLSNKIRDERLFDQQIPIIRESIRRSSQIRDE